MRVQLSRTAQHHLKELDDYIAERSPAGSERVTDGIYDIIEKLTDFPQLGHVGRVAGTREFAVPKTQYILAYFINGDTVTVLAVIHGAQLWPRKFN